MGTDVSIIIVNYYGFQYVDRCVSSVLQCTYQQFEITVVDNGSTDESVKKLQKKYGD